MIDIPNELLYHFEGLILESIQSILNTFFYEELHNATPTPNYIEF